MSLKFPPMGWNSFDCFGASVTEAEVLANAEFLSKHLKPFGWDHVVVDYCWSHPCPPACTNPNQVEEFQPYLTMDGDFRLWPSPERFPSAAGWAGFRPLADAVHAMGLKFGIHIMRGLPRQAFYPGYPAVTLGHRAMEMADPEDTCRWLNHMYGIRPASEAGQDYYDSLFRLYASWGVDFVKADDLVFPYRAAEIEMIDRARKRAGRPIMLSLSPGPCSVDCADHIAAHAELWRISADFWDDWKKLREMFRLCSEWAPHRRPSAWPDADMLPVGRLSKRGPVGPEHDSYFTAAEQRSLITLWCLFGSPLFIGGNLPEMDPATLALLTNPEILALQQIAGGAVPVGTSSHPDLWVLAEEDGGTFHLGLFNLEDETAERSILWNELGFSEPPLQIRNLWSRETRIGHGDALDVLIAPHGCEVFTVVFDLAARMERHGQIQAPSARTAMAV